MGAGGGQQPGETRLECDKPVLLLVCVNELGLFPSSQVHVFQPPCKANLLSEHMDASTGVRCGGWW